MRLKKDNFTVASSTTTSREPPRPTEDSSLPPLTIWLTAALQNAAELYKAENYEAAASCLSAALQDCSKGAVLVRASGLGDPVNVNFEHVSKVFGFIESRLVACYLKMGKSHLALPHSYRSIRQNPIHFRSHLQQAMMYGLLGNPSMAVRSAMIADYMLWLGGNGDPAISNRIKLHWQRMLEEAVQKHKDFSVLYTPCSGKPTREEILKAEQTLRGLGPNFCAYIYTDPEGGHILPKTTDWSKSTTINYMLTLGFKREQDGIFLNKLLHKSSLISTGPQAPFILLTPDSPANMCEAFEKRILPVLEFINCTKLSAGFSMGSGVIEKLQYADCLDQLRREQEHEQVLEQTLAELAVAPYLQDVSPADIKLLQILTADTTDALNGKKTDRIRVWNGVKQQVGPTVNASSAGMSTPEPGLVMLWTNSKEIPYQQLSPVSSPACNWGNQIFCHMQSHPQQPMYLYPQAKLLNPA